MKANFKNILVVLTIINFGATQTFAQSSKTNTVSVAQQQTDSKKTFVRFNAFPIPNSEDRNILFEVCAPEENVIKCSPLGNGYYSLQSIKKEVDHAIRLTVGSYTLAAIVAAVAVAAALPAAGAITISGMSVIGAGGYIAGNAGLAVAAGAVVATYIGTTVYLFGASNLASLGIGSAYAGAVVASNNAAPLVLTMFGLSVALPFAVGWKILDVVGLNPVKNHRNANRLNDLYKEAGKSGSTQDIATVDKLLKELKISAPFSPAQVEQVRSQTILP